MSTRSLLAHRVPRRALRRGFAAFVAVRAAFMTVNGMPQAWVAFVAEHANWTALAGGALIGLAAAMLLLFNGRIAGVSGILAGALAARRSERLWRAMFLAGLLAGGGLFVALAPEAMPVALPRSAAVVVIAGLLVGYGTQLGSGCTSGHGVCGIARLSVRSLVATATFMATAIVTVLLMGGV